jgi:hypothetical protein
MSTLLKGIHNLDDFIFAPYTLGREHGFGFCPKPQIQFRSGSASAAQVISTLKKAYKPPNRSLVRICSALASGLQGSNVRSAVGMKEGFPNSGSD